MELLVTLIGLVLVVEAIPYVAFPEAMQRWLRQIQELPPATLRHFGLVALALGLLLCWLARRTNLFS